MKYFIVSDIHGSAYYCQKALECFEREKAGRILMLGDILYHGPRNDLPRDYAPKKVIEMLNPLAGKILCVRGNCEAEVDQMVLSFPVLAEYCIIDMGENIIFATHGHKYNASAIPPLCPGDILLCGHTHVPKIEECGGVTYLNPGSAAIPKEGSWNGYMTYEDGVFTWKGFDGEVKMTYSVKKQRAEN
jgi:putative phosphoesterase